MATQSPTYVPQDYPEAVVFDQRDGIYWLDERSLGVVRAATGVEYAAAKVGFDRGEATAQALWFMSRGIKVGLREGNNVRLLRPRAKREPSKVQSRPILIAPETLLDATELARLRERLGKPSCQLRKWFEHWRAILASEARDLPSVYVFELSGGIYEVDWDLTGLDEQSLQGLALAVHDAGCPLPCRLIEPRRARSRGRSAVVKSAMVYGQLRLAI